MNKYSADKSFGTNCEHKVLDYLNNTANFAEHPLEMFKNKYSTMDFINHNGVIAELKSRRCYNNSYPDTMVGYNKIKKLREDGDDGINYEFYFLFRNGLYLWKYKEGEYEIRQGGRTDRGRDEIKEYAFVKTEYLSLVDTSITSF
jgi:hypothetical protein